MVGMGVLILNVAFLGELFRYGGIFIDFHDLIPLYCRSIAIRYRWARTRVTIMVTFGVQE